MAKRKSVTKIYVVEYIKELIKTLTREDGSVDAETLLKAIDKAFPKGAVYTETETTLESTVNKISE